ncbi:hypothetical protein HZ326_0762 [Fusarium oxysporum f. sp. albedinis]|nr:hypothetical protein HZ326_0762 [Fusarium oxysporum f. sp. albedinis]
MHNTCTSNLTSRRIHPFFRNRNKFTFHIHFIFSIKHGINDPNMKSHYESARLFEPDNASIEFRPTVNHNPLNSLAVQSTKSFRVPSPAWTPANPA